MLEGRHLEVQQVEQSIAAGETVVLTGPAGIGKTTVARHALRSGGPWAEGGALATLSWVPFLPFQRILNSEVSGSPAAVARAVAKRGLTAILIDDLQWADNASLEVIAELADRLPIVVTVRTGEVNSQHVLDALACVGALPLAIAPLDPTDARRVVRAKYPVLPDVDVSRIVAQAAGNPLLLVELPRSRGEEPTLVSALMGRLTDLDPAVRHATERLAVIGRPLDENLLASHVTDLVDSGFGHREAGKVTIRHALLGEMIVASLGERANEIRHELAKEVEPAEAAHLLAMAQDYPAARAMALRAADTASDPLIQAELLDLAITCSPEGEYDVARRAQAAAIYCAYSHLDRAHALCAIAPELSDRVERGMLVAADAQVAWLAGDLARFQTLAAQAMEDLDGSETPAEALVLAGSTLLDTRVSLDGRPAMQRAHDAVALADKVGAHQRFARLRLASVLQTSGEPGWQQLLADVIEDADRCGEMAERRSATTSLVLGQWLTGDPRLAHELAWRDIARGPDHDHDLLWLSEHSYAAMIGLLIGVDRQLIIDRHLPVLQTEPLFRNRTMMATAVGLALVDHGRSGDIATLSIESAPYLDRHRLDRSLAYWLKVESAWLTGQFDVAIEALTASASNGNHPAAMQARIIGGHAARQLDRYPLPDAAPQSIHRAWHGAPVEWQALVAASQGRHDDAVVAFDEAAQLWDGHDVRSATRCRWAAGEEAVLRGSDDAIERLTNALRQAEHWGLTAMADRGRASLRAVGQNVRRTTESGHGGVTAREEQILRMVGEGSTSKEIAIAIGISPSTVESIVRTAVRKLGATNRMSAAALLKQRAPN